MITMDFGDEEFCAKCKADRRLHYSLVVGKVNNLKHRDFRNNQPGAKLLRKIAKRLPLISDFRKCRNRHT